MKVIKKVALAVFHDKKMLMVRSHKKEKVFYSLGGKLEAGESDLECLKREIKEEVGCVIDPKSIQFLNEFEEIADGKKDAWLKIRMYTGELIGEPKASSEIAGIGWLDSNSDPNKLSIMAKKQFIPWLKQYGYIN